MHFPLRSSAKINLSLDILSRRADGYHELASVVHTIGLYDEIELDVTEGGAVSLECEDAELGGEANLCARAVRLWNETTRENLGARIRLKKNIPTGAGLGGGSGNAAAVLLALRRVSNAAISEEELNQIAARLGADVPLFTRGGALSMEGIGEKLTPLTPLEGWIVLVKPAVSLATPPMYRAWDESALESVSATPALLESWGDLRRVAARLGNDFERVVAELTRAPLRCVELLSEVGALGARMSGSGSACYGLFGGVTTARRAAARLEAALAKDVLTQGAAVWAVPLVARAVEFG